MVSTELNLPFLTGNERFTFALLRIYHNFNCHSFSLKKNIENNNF